MPEVLIDTSTLVDLVLFCQTSNARLRSVASSASAAVEALIFYETPRVDGPSFNGLLEDRHGTRYLEFYGDDSGSVAGRLRDLLAFCRPLQLTGAEVVATYDRGVDLLDAAMATVEDQEDLRAYDLYDYLPYHLGEDTTAIECRITGKSVADVEDLISDFPDDLAAVIRRYGCILRQRAHPTRAAWGLPMLRMLYYEVVQTEHMLHYSPHATKATIRFGRPEETVRSKRFLDYCHAGVRDNYTQRLRETLGSREISIPVPPVSGPTLGGSVCWTELMGLIARLRASREAARYRSAFTALLEELGRPGRSADLSALLAEIDASVQAWRDRLPTNFTDRHISISVPIFDHSLHQSSGRSLVLTNPVMPGC